MVKTRGKFILAWPSFGSPRAALSVKIAEHSPKNGLQDPETFVEATRTVECRVTGKTTIKKEMVNIRKKRSKVDNESI